jgi:hypothetical protein
VRGFLPFYFRFLFFLCFLLRFPGAGYGKQKPASKTPARIFAANESMRHLQRTKERISLCARHCILQSG